MMEEAGRLVLTQTRVLRLWFSNHPFFSFLLTSKIHRHAVSNPLCLCHCSVIRVSRWNSSLKSIPKTAMDRIYSLCWILLQTDFFSYKVVEPQRILDGAWRLRGSWRGTEAQGILQGTRRLRGSWRGQGGSEDPPGGREAQGILQGARRLRGSSRGHGGSGDAPGGTVAS